MPPRRDAVDAAAAGRPEGGPAGLLRLQRAAGNRAVQRVVEFRSDRSGSRRGFTNTARYKNQLTDQQKARYDAMHEAQNRQYSFADGDDAFAHLQSNGATNPPTAGEISRGGQNDVFTDVMGTEAFGPTGSSIYLDRTQPDMNNWFRFLLLHKNAALQLVPPDVAHDAVRVMIETYYGNAVPTARKLDAWDRAGELTTVTTTVTLLAEPLVIKDAVEHMYTAARAASIGIPGTQPRITVPIFGPMNGNRMGTWAGIAFQKGASFPEGSSAAGSYTDIPWEGRLKRRRTPNGEKVYIRGHLLNDHLGGPVAPYNLVPLVGVDVPGAPNANSAHSSIVEGQARSAFKTLSKNDDDGSSSPTGPTYRGLRYAVAVAGYGGHVKVAAIANRLHSEAMRIRVWLSMAARNLNVASNAVTLTQYKAYLGNGSQDPALQGRYAEEWTNRAKLYLRTVWDTDRDRPLAEVLTLLDENIALWRHEADVLPTALAYSFDLTDCWGEVIADSGLQNLVPAGPVANPFMKYQRS